MLMLMSCIRACDSIYDTILLEKTAPYAYKERYSKVRYSRSGRSVDVFNVLIGLGSGSNGGSKVKLRV